MMTAIPDAILLRIGQLVRLLGSNYDGEALGAARAINRVLGGAGLVLDDLAHRIEHAPQPVVLYRDAPPSKPTRPRKRRGQGQPRPGADWIEIGMIQHRDIIDALQDGIDDVGSPLTPWEVEFAESIVASLRGTRHRLSHRQMEIVERILGKLEETRS